MIPDRPCEDPESSEEPSTSFAKLVLGAVGGVLSVPIAFVAWSLASIALREGAWPQFLRFCLAISSGGLCATGALALRGREDRRRTERARAEAKNAYERLAGRIIELYGTGASTGTAGAEAVTLFLEAEEDLEPDPQEASRKIRLAAAKLDEVDGRRAGSANGIDQGAHEVPLRRDNSG